MESGKSNKALNADDYARSVAHWFRHALALKDYLGIELPSELDPFELVETALARDQRYFDFSQVVEEAVVFLRAEKNLHNFTDRDVLTRRLQVLVLNIPEVLKSDRPVVAMEYNLERIHDCVGRLGYDSKSAFPLWVDYWEKWLSDIGQEQT